jgi:hypothetical protein
VLRKAADPKKVEVATEKLTGLSDARKASEATAQRDRHRMYAGMLRAYGMGLTYDDIAEITGMSKIRVSQVLAEQRALKVPAKPARKAPAKSKGKATTAKKTTRKRAAA